MDIMSKENAECTEEVSFLFVYFNSSFYSLYPLHTLCPPFGPIVCFVTFTCLCPNAFTDNIRSHMIFMRSNERAEIVKNLLPKVTVCTVHTHAVYVQYNTTLFLPVA